MQGGGAKYQPNTVKKKMFALKTQFWTVEPEITKKSIISKWFINLSILKSKKNKTK